MISALSITLAITIAACVISIASIIWTRHSEAKIKEYNEQWQVRIIQERNAAIAAKLQATKIAASAKTQQATNTTKSRLRVKPKPVVVEPPKEAVPQLPIERFYDDPRIE